MRIRSVQVNQFKRFADLRIADIPETARLVMLAGPNGFGKSSLFDAFMHAFARLARRGLSWDPFYHARGETQLHDAVQVSFNAADGVAASGEANGHLFYFRTAYRNEPDLNINAIQAVERATLETRFDRMSFPDQSVSANFRRLVGNLIGDLVAGGTQTLDQFRAAMFSTIAESMQQLFPDLRFEGFKNPLDRGTFYFTKGAMRDFRYPNLSGGEKAAFDIILDLATKRREYHDSVFCIDEPELHLNPSIHGRLLDVILDLVPENGQVWLATHSIGMMRRAIEIERASPGSVVFLDFSNQDFDGPVTLKPTKPTRAFWLDMLKVALHDLADLVAPSTVVVCEGTASGKNADHDATCYNTIFAPEYPEVQFLSGGSTSEVQKDRMGFFAALPTLTAAIEVRRLIDRDDHSASDVTELEAKDVKVLGLRTLESYLWDDEVLTLLCESVGKPEETSAVLQLKQDALAASVTRGNPADDLRSAAGTAYTTIKTKLGLTAVGNDARSFERSTLAPLVRPGTRTYANLKSSVF